MKIEGYKCDMCGREFQIEDEGQRNIEFHTPTLVHYLGVDICGMCKDKLIEFKDAVKKEKEGFEKIDKRLKQLEKKYFPILLNN